MKDLLIALAILLILVAVFSHTPQTPPQRDNTASGTQTKGESDTVLHGSEDTQYAEPPQSPQTGGWRWFI